MALLRKYSEFFGSRVRRMFALSVFVGIFVFAIESSFVFVFQGFLRAVKLVEPDKLLLPDWYPDSLTSAVALLVVFGVMRSIGYLAKTFLGGTVSQAFNRVQRERILKFALENAERLNSHEVVNVYMERINQAGLLVNLGAQLVLACTTAGLFLLLGLRMAPLEMGIAIGLLAIFLLPMRALNERIQRAGEGIAQESEIANRSLLQGLRHYFFLRIYGLIPREIETGHASIRSYEEHYRKFYRAHALKHSYPQAAGIIVVGIITYVSVQVIQTPSVKLISFFYIFMRLAQTASESSATFSEFRLQLPGFQRLFSWYERIMALPLPVAKAIDPAILSSFQKDVETSGLSFEASGIEFDFEPGNPVIRDLNLSIGRGDVLVIRGESGAGKSTLLALLLGLLVPSKGWVRVNGRPIEAVCQSLGPYLAYVGPDPFLISGSVRDNLLYGHPNVNSISDSKLWAALESAQVASVVRTLEKQLGEQLHEHTQLSTGQRQRLAIARAILREPRMLILDEASANLDEATERNFIDGLSALLPGLTTFIISHKSSFDRVATKKLELKKIASTRS